MDSIYSSNNSIQLPSVTLIEGACCIYTCVYDTSVRLDPGSTDESIGTAAHIAVDFASMVENHRWCGCRWQETNGERRLVLYEAAAPGRIIRVTDHEVMGRFEDAIYGCQQRSWNGVAYYASPWETKTAALAGWRTIAFAPESAVAGMPNPKFGVIPFELI